ncbi:MAG: hypothetical protein Q9170_001605 [Blastenia crenularia]
MSYIYFNKYHRFHRISQTPDPLDPYVRLPNSYLQHPGNIPYGPLDPTKSRKTLSLATLSLASKSTESPRRLSSLLLPAHRLLHPPSSSSPLTIPSPAYDSLRATLVQAELVLLRVLGFELRLPSPMEYLHRYLERAMEDVERVGEDYDAWDREGKEEYGVVDGAMDTGLGRMCKERAVEA